MLFRSATTPPRPHQTKDWRPPQCPLKAADGITSRAPNYLDPLDSPQYYGTVVVDPAVTTGVPVIYRLNADSTVASKLDLAA